MLSSYLFLLEPDASFLLEPLFLEEPFLLELDALFLLELASFLLEFDVLFLLELSILFPPDICCLKQ